MSGLLGIGGNIASDAVDTGNPIKIGGYGSTTSPAAVAAGDRINTWHSLHGAVATFLATTGGTVITNITASSDAGNTASIGLVTGSFGYLYNPTDNDWDRARTIVNATDSTGVGIAAMGVLAQLDNTSPTAITENQFGNLRMDPARNLGVAPSPYPVNAVASTATSGLVSNASAVATLTGVASRTMYITGYDCHAGTATAAARVSIVVSGTITGSMTNAAFATNATTFVPAPVPTLVHYDPPIPASAANTSIVVTMGAVGSGGATAVCNAYGYTLP